MHNAHINSEKFVQYSQTQKTSEDDDIFGGLALLFIGGFGIIEAEI